MSESRTVEYNLITGVLEAVGYLDPEPIGIIGAIDEGGEYAMDENGYFESDE